MGHNYGVHGCLQLGAKNHFTKAIGLKKCIWFPQTDIMIDATVCTQDTSSLKIRAAMDPDLQYLLVDDWFSLDGH
jgi:hypothetical protein